MVLADIFVQAHDRKRPSHMTVVPIQSYGVPGIEIDPRKPLGLRKIGFKRRDRQWVSGSRLHSGDYRLNEARWFHAMVVRTRAIIRFKSLQY
jgi:hypothetical protein